MMIDGYYDPPDWDPHHMNEDWGNASMNYSAQILGLMFLFVCPMVIMNLMVAVAVSSAQNMQMKCMNARKVNHIEKVSLTYQNYNMY